MSTKQHILLISILAACGTAVAAPNAMPLINPQAIESAAPPHGTTASHQPMDIAPAMIRPIAIRHAPSATVANVPHRDAQAILAPAPASTTAAPQIANSIPAIDPNSPAAQLSALQAQIAVLKAKSEVAKLQQSIAKVSETPTSQAPSAFLGTSFERSMSPVSPYRLLGVSGFDGKLSARITSAERGVQTVTMGQTLAHGWEVVSITSRQIVLRHARTERILEVR